jgi:hypothetical protein
MDKAMIERLLGPRADEVGCDECFDRLDEYVEAERRGARVDPRMTAHLEGCPTCAEEHDALREFAR